MNEPTDVPSRQDTLRVAMNLIRTHAKFVQQAYHTFRHHGLTGSQFDVLATLHRGEGLMQQELASQMLVSKGNITGIVARMEALGWIERRPDPDDHRPHRLYLTDQGKAVFAEVAPERRDTIHEIMADFQPDEVRMLSHLLSKLESGIEKINKR
jgi:DNA-binding MarR family transcriptional regulator